MLAKLKAKFAKKVTTEVVKETKRGIKAILPKVLGCLTAVILLVAGTRTPLRTDEPVVNNYYIYNGPVYSHEKQIL